MKTVRLSDVRVPSAETPSPAVSLCHQKANNEAFTLWAGYWRAFAAMASSGGKTNLNGPTRSSSAKLPAHNMHSQAESLQSAV